MNTKHIVLKCSVYYNLTEDILVCLPECRNIEIKKNIINIRTKFKIKFSPFLSYLRFFTPPFVECFKEREISKCVSDLLDFYEISGFFL